MARYYYKNAKGSFMVLKTPFQEPLPQGITASTVDEYEEAMSRAARENAENPNRGLQKEIAELKWNLSSTDYKAIKYAEGVISEEEYAPIKEQRQAWRARINEIESLLGE